MGEYKVAGKSLTRIDVPDKAVGSTRFASDTPRPERTLCSLVLRSPHAHARVLSVNADRARKIPGVRVVLTRDECPNIRFGGDVKDQSWLAKDGYVRYVGEPVALVAAENIDAAKAALEAIDVHYKILPPLKDAISGKNSTDLLVHDDWKELGLESKGGGRNVIASFERTMGDIEAGFDEADRVYEHTFKTEYAHPGYLELHSVLADVGGDGKITIWTCTQSPFEIRDEVCEALGLPQTKVRIVPTELGGGFGGKTRAVLEHLAGLLALRSGQAVRMEMTREEDHQAGSFRHPHTFVIKTGVKNDGTLVARDMDVTMEQGAHGKKAARQCSSKIEMASSMYRIPNVRVRGCTVYSNGPLAGPVRAPSGPQYHFATEVQMDIIARDLGLDPLEIRRRNELRKGDKSLAGVHRDGGMKLVMERIAEDVNWDEPFHLPVELEGDGWKAGRGLALGFMHGAGGASSCSIRLNGDGTFQIIAGTIDMSGSSTGLSQLAAEELGVSLDEVRYDCGDTDVAPESIRATGSMVTRSVGLAVLKAAKDAREKIFQVAAAKLEASPDDLAVEEGRVFVRSAPDRSMTLAQVSAASPSTGGFIIGQGMSEAPTTCPVYTSQIAEVAVNQELGEIRVLRLIGAQDVGFAINPLAIVGQMEGGMLQGLGLALMEEQPRREDGSLEGESLHDYLMPTSMDVPEMKSIIVENPADDTPYGIRGVGEPPIVATVAAIVNAIQDAVGEPFFSLPVKPHQLQKTRA
ncbi:MAG: xanthine dehydrogenase family protein molybdopterin-binding subunit [Nitrospinaceae bacterium]|jgi:CO/xanthine dehydrogenase Mo-binding subunit|nr:xanthine dehydrogenase family protein molybdopterin-binding subunit [Nitrospinaceae bacterium]MBT3433579.1 xanthine dehydrogenase family protein molybdopterin-binding subunit [Nitrospinaceae bacterium]MBT3822340.1 xanthine dehydrogenase family protein molybdopterin-binding subunit [Nitrospinaceae bacterium]MBT4093211.1 xanthine dehydrogenase family protein molybdopterin-binding subunit [Nitrospinaceae bacterium]MBT5369332.1 xanthine dehydrogenase family protein molybdopterin-binding subunit 